MEILIIGNIKNENTINHDEINNIKLGVKYNIIKINIDDNYIILLEIFGNILRLCNNMTQIFLHRNKLSEKIIKLYNDKINTILYQENDIIVSIKKYIIDNYNKKLPTIITSLYDIRKIENNNDNQIKHIDEYFNRGKNLLELEIPMIIYTDKSLIEKIKNIRPFQYHNITNFIVIEFNDLYYSKYTNKIKENMNKFKILNASTSKETPMYFTLTNNKFDFISNSIRNNPFDSTHFIWIDFGISHIAKYMNSVRRWIYCIHDKIRELELVPFLENNNYKEYFKNIHHNVAGGLISGDIIHLKQYCELYEKKLEQILNENWYQLDEAIMTIINNENMNLICNYYGNFQNIISGYDTYFCLNDNADHCYNVITRNISIYLDKNLHNKAYDMLTYIKNYSLYNPNKHEAYLYQYIICNYYVSINKILDNDIVESLIDLPISIEFINKIKNNLKFYKNYNYIIKD